MRAIGGLSALYALGVGACATTAVGPVEKAAVMVPVADPPVKASGPMLLVAMPSSPEFAAVRKTLVSEVSKDFNITTLTVSAETRVEDLAAVIDKTKPVCTVLMNNATVNLYQQYQAAHPEGLLPPAVIVMSAFVDEAKAKLRRATGIAYEVPGVTAFVHLRAVVSAPVSRVGVVYRPAFQKFIERQRKLAAAEHVEIVGVPLAGEVTVKSLRRALRDLTARGGVDAIWMLNDNALLRDGQFLEETWKAELGNTKLPLIVGVPNLVDPETPLGTLAVVPDTEALGLQTANLIFDLAENDWKVEDHPTELPLSVKTIVDLRTVRGSFGLRADALQHIDQARE